MKLVTAEQMRTLDRTAINKIGIPGIVLMENAAHGVYEIIASRAVPLAGKKACIVCGRGNNGGDGFALARILLNAGAKPVVVLAADPGKVSGDARINFDICRKLNIPVKVVADEKQLPALRAALRSADLVVDALLGTGLAGAVKPFFKKIIDIINTNKTTVYAVDVPSGVIVNTGQVLNAAVRADHTITFGAPKIGLFVYPGAEFAGQVYIADIGIPTHLIENLKTITHLTSPFYMSAHVLKRRADAHKGACGKVLAIGGSMGMSGAVCLAGSSALRTGAGLVRLAVPETIADVVEKKFTEGVTLPQPDVDGALSELCLDDLKEKITQAHAVILGPGMGVRGPARKVVEQVLIAARVPVVVDADALNCLAALKSLGFLKKLKAPVILTPHPGEMARLLKSSTEAVQADRLGAARAFAKKHKVTLVLKGAYSIIASPEGIVYVNPTGNAGMATAGSGDVLSGVIGALAAEGLDAFAAAVCGAYIHGQAGDTAAQQRGERSVTAGSISAALTLVMKKLEGERRAK